MLGYIGLAGAYFLSWYLFACRKFKDKPDNILAFHDISDEFNYSITRINPAKFRRLLDFLNELGCHCTSLENMKSETDLALTFDDGWESFYTNVFPELHKRQFSATVFVIAGYVGKKSSWDYKSNAHLSWEQVRTLAGEGIEIASHSVSHVDLRSLNDNRLEYEIAGSKKMIEDKLGLPIKHFSYPFGRYDRRVMEIVQKAGYENAFTLGGGGQEFAVSRQAVYLYDTPYSLYLKLVKHSRIEQCKDYINNSLAGGTIALRKLFPVDYKD